MTTPMLLDQDNVVPEMNSPADVVAPSSEVPRVAVVYRSRGVSPLLIPPLLILVAVASVVLYRGWAPRNPKVIYVRAAPETTDVAPPSELVGPPDGLRAESRIEPKTDSTPPVASSKPSIEQPIQPIATEPAPVPAPAATLAEQPSALSRPEAKPRENLEPPPSYAAAEPVPGEPAAPAVKSVARKPVIGFDPDALRAALAGPDVLDTPPVPEGVVAADPDPAPEPVEVFAPRDRAPNMLQIEAKRIATERRRLAAARKGVVRANPAVDRQLRTDRIAAARRDADAQRQPFLDELRKILHDQGDAAAPAIEELCNATGRETATELLDAAFGELSGPAARLSTKGKVQRLRLWGVPEPIILDHIMDTESANIGGRNGIKSQGELIVRAARLLSGIPLNKPATATAAASDR